MRSPRFRPAVLAALLAGITACSSDAPTGLSPSTPIADALTAAGADRETGRFEVPNMEFAIDHHAMGVKMATLCVQKAVHAELRQLCEMNRQN